MSIAEITTMKRLEQQLLAILPPTIRERMRSLFPQIVFDLQEIRIRQQRPLQLNIAGKENFLTTDGRLTEQQQGSFVVQAEDVFACLQLITKSSLYALEEELKKGFITIEGGHRVGIAGRIVLDTHGNIQTMREISQLNIRVARAIQGASKGLEQVLADPIHKTIFNTLIIAPPQCGKTTLLRDLCQRISDGTFHPGVSGLKVGLVDERSELAAMVQGVPQHAVGVRTDILDACPKAIGIQMLIRSMSPDVIMTDEIGREEDSYAILEALHAGIKVVTTAHGMDLQDVRTRRSLDQLFSQQIFERFVMISRRKGVCTIEGVFNKDGRIITTWRGDRHA